MMITCSNSLTANQWSHLQLKLLSAVKHVRYISSKKLDFVLFHTEDKSKARCERREDMTEAG